MSNPFDETQKSGGNPFDETQMAPANYVKMGDASAPKPDPIMMGNDIRSLGTDAQRNKIIQDQKDALKDFTLRSGPPAIGQGIGAATGPLAPVMVPLLGGFGGMGGEYAAQAREGGPRRWGAIFGAGLTGAIPGSPLAGAGTKTMIREGLKYGAANLAGKTLETAVDEGRAPTLAEGAMALGSGAIAPVVGKALDAGSGAAEIVAKKSRNEVFDATRKAALDVGFVVPPPALQNEMPGAFADAANYGAGTKEIFKEASKRNQVVTNEQARAYAGLPENVPLGTGKNGKNAIDEAIKVAGKPYQQVANISPVAKMNLEIMQQARADAKKYWKAYANPDGNFSPKLLQEAKYQDGLADIAHVELVGEARAAGKGDLVDKMEEARIKLAKLHFLDWNTNPSTGNVSAAGFGKAIENGVPMTDEGKIIGDAYNAFPSALQDASKLGNVGSKTSIIDGITRKFQLSPMRQYVNTPYGMMQPDLLARFMNQGTMAAGRNAFATPIPQASRPQNNPFLQPQP